MLKEYIPVTLFQGKNAGRINNHSGFTPERLLIIIGTSKKDYFQIMLMGYMLERIKVVSIFDLYEMGS